jgi:choline dehydrogenase-like flavoprotein
MSGVASDVIVVGSGASAVHAAYAIVERGASVLMLDVGTRDQTYEPLIPDGPFTRIRRTDGRQHRYFLGDRFEGIPLASLGAGPQMTPPRQYVLENARAFSPIDSQSFEALQSFALGGLASTWGAVAFPFLDQELVRAGLSPQELRPHYKIVARRIGVCGEQDDLGPLHGAIESLLPPLDLDHNAGMLLSHYQEKRNQLQKRGIRMGRPLMAVLTQPLRGRSAHAYHDMDFWSNAGASVYRPASTLHELSAMAGFSYRPSCLVESFSEHGERIRLHVKPLATGGIETLETRRLVLAAGALGTGRIVLKSLARYDSPVPITCNPHLYMPCLHYRNLGAAPSDRCHSLAQLTAIYDPSGDREHLVQAQLYSYRSLLLFRLLKESLLPYRESLRVMRLLYSSMVLLVIQFEDSQAPGKHCILRRGLTGRPDRLEISYTASDDALGQTRRGVKAFRGLMRQLGCLPLRVVQAPHGSSVHYASLLPFHADEKLLATAPSGRLWGTRGVYIGDGASFAYLPAKGLTLTLMANANRIGQNVCKDLESPE